MNTINKSLGNNFDDCLDSVFKQIQEDRFFYVKESLERIERKEKKQSENKIVGYLSNTIPLEILHAAGAMPFHLIGDPNEATPLADEFMEPAFDPITRSIFQKLLAGEYSHLDLIVLPRSNDSYQRLYYYICEIHRKYPKYQLPPVYLVDLLHSPSTTAKKHNDIKVKEFLDFVQGFFQCEIDEEALNNSIQVYNQGRQLLHRLNQLRATHTIASELIYIIYSAAFSIPIEIFNESLSNSLPKIEKLFDQYNKEDVAESSSTAKKRVIIVGNGLDHPALHYIIDNNNAIVVGDYHAYGNHFLTGQINQEDFEKESNQSSVKTVTNAGIKAISNHYYRDTKSSRSFMTQGDDACKFAKQQQADGVIFFYIKKEEALSWHYPKQRSACEKAGLKHLLLTDQPYQVDNADTIQRIKDFIHE